mgnify:CR=1 FL=1
MSESNENDYVNRSREYFDTIASEYDDSHDGKFVKCMYKEILMRVKKIGVENVLDLGCGNGNVSGMIAEETEAHVTGLDLSQQMIEQAKKRVGAKAQFIVGNAEKLPFADHTFDMIICNASFHHYPHPVTVVKEMKRVLKQNGTLILGDPTVPVKLFLKLMNWILSFSDNGDFHIYVKKEIVTLLRSQGLQVSDWKMIGAERFILNARNV